VALEITPGANTYELGQVDISNLLTSNPTLQQIVKAALSSNQWPNGNQVCPTYASWWFPGIGWFGGGDPTAIGYSIPDPNYGNVLVACDANGVLHYIINSPVDPTVQNLPPYVSPPGPGGTPVCPGWSNIQSVNDLLACISSGLNTAETIALGIAAYLIWKEIK
jgi:hypothetical protein